MAAEELRCFVPSIEGLSEHELHGPRRLEGCALPPKGRPTLILAMLLTVGKTVSERGAISPEIPPAAYGGVICTKFTSVSFVLAC